MITTQVHQAVLGFLALLLIILAFHAGRESKEWQQHERDHDLPNHNYKGFITARP